MEFASAKQSVAEKPAWPGNLPTNIQARSKITIRNQCKKTHSFTLDPSDVPYLQLPASPTVQVAGRSDQELGVVFNTIGMRPGDYRGSVAVKCETCGEEKGCSQDNQTLPVHLTVTAAFGTPTPSPTPTPEVSPTPTPTPTPWSDGPGPGVVRIMGQKVNDLNCNGKNDNEPGLSGWTITLKNTGTGATLTTVTDATGFYSFNSVPAGTYAISETSQSGWAQSMPANPGTHTVTVTGGGVPNLTFGETIRKDFANCKQHVEVGKLTGRKINDLNCNGKVDTNEPGLAGWVIAATNNGSGSSATTVTDANGFYSFNLAAGSYTISESLQTGWTQTMPGLPGTYAVTVAPGLSIEKDFLNCKKSDDTRECATVTAREAVCKMDGSGGYTYTFSVTNNSGKDVTQILLTPPPGSGLVLSDQTFPLTTPLPNGQSTTITVDIGNVKPGTPPCFFVTLMSKDGPCCTIKVCPVLPDCCATATGKFACDPKGSYTGSVTIVNTSANTIKNIYLYPPAGVTMSQTYFAVTLAPGQSFTTPLITIKGAKPGRLCFRVSMHTEDMKECCTVDVCIVLPECGHPAGDGSGIPITRPPN